VQKTFSGHRHYVQGVAWDPLGELILTQSTDRTMRVLRSSAGAKQRSKAGQTDLAAAATFTQAHVVYKHVVADPTPDDNSSKKLAASHVSQRSGAGNDTSENCAAPANAAQTSASAPTSTEATRAQGVAIAGTTPAAAQARAAEAGDAAVAADGAAAGYIFQDESLNTFFRRLAFSPEGSFVVAPAASLGPLAPSSRCALVCTLNKLHASRPIPQRVRE
jgi:chromatin assembly factor 1 subunit B